MEPVSCNQVSRGLIYLSRERSRIRVPGEALILCGESSVCASQARHELIVPHGWGLSGAGTTARVVTVVSAIQSDSMGKHAGAGSRGQEPLRPYRD